MSVTFQGYSRHPIEQPDSFVDKYQEKHIGNTTEGYDEACEIKNNNLRHKLVSKDCQKCAETFRALNESADKQTELGDSPYNLHSDMARFKTKELEKIMNTLCEEN